MLRIAAYGGDETAVNWLWAMESGSIQIPRLGMECYEARNAVGTHVKTGHRVAVKILNRAQIAEMNMKEKVQREIAYLSRFSHPHINRLYEVIYTQTDIFMVIEFLSGGELFDHIVSK